MKGCGIISLFTYTFSKIIPKKENRWIFGAWFGNAVSDNPRSFFEYVKINHPEVEIVWVINKVESEDIKGSIVVKRNSIKSLKYILTAKVAVMNQGFMDFCDVNLLGGCYKVQLWHGVAWKRIVRDAMPETKTVQQRLHRRLFGYINQYDLYIAPSEEQGKVLKTAFNAKEKQILYVGQPRNVVLFDKQYCQRAKEELQETLGTKGKKIILYMPTFRDGTKYVFSFGEEEIEKEVSLLAQKYNFVIVEKSHYKTTQRYRAYKDYEKGCVHIMPTADAQWLLAAADVLITDYSSCFFDYLVRNKPIIHYIYDYEYYRTKDRGLYYKLEEVASGDCVYNTEQLKESIAKNIEDDNVNRDIRIKIKEKYINFECADNNEKIYEQIKVRI